MNLYYEIMNKSNTIFIESTSGTKGTKFEKAKGNIKSIKKVEKSMKKTLVSPFKKIYDTKKDIK